jgi:chorismate dehydratase
MSYFCATKIQHLERKIKVSAVSYLNAKPLLHGIYNHEVMEQIELTMEYPALVAKKLIEDTADVGLVSTAALLKLPKGKIISDYGIAASGKVASVCIYSEKPIEEIDTLYLDYQSKTSVKLAEILLQEYWQQSVKFIDAPENFIELIGGNTAAVIIGDRALKANHRFEHVYDLSEAWQAHTGLDFIFAAWIANKELPQHFTEVFNKANEMGVAAATKVADTIDFPEYDLAKYYTENIQYKFDENKLAGLALFLEKIKRLA